MKTAIVILNWNGRDLLAKFLPSVIAHSAAEATIYVADNASTDDSVEFLRTNFPQVKRIQNTENGGYARGYNLALKEVVEDLVVLMNSDIETTAGWLTPVINAFQANSNLGAAQPKILDYKNPEYFEYAGAAGGFLDALGYPYCRGRIFETVEKDIGQYNEDARIFWASGACFAVKKSVFWKAGALDEDFFAHQEEIDLCWRINALGHEVKYIANSSVYHVGGATLGAMNPQKTFLNFRNTLFALLKNVSSGKVYFLIFTRMCLDAIAAGKFIVERKPRHSWAIFRAHIDFYRNFYKMYKKRSVRNNIGIYFEENSIVWSYFVKRKKIYTKN
ncbi:glycosyltransferase family 2 protein [Flavimarina sp. Hel_I_48]|uniref:glycosyltransferase family 2 protein n=1 Tax=Flavimarina sp. Hel_I_48 TaxID=1392488 RepID=UPI0004DF8C31|nr:glycosyltransferase family 2 protein [Flavimarina sp. Hel_I_48]